MSSLPQVMRTVPAIGVADVGVSRRVATAARVSWLSKCYAWSLVLEPMLFFVVFERTFSGVTGQLGRLLQPIVIGGLVLRALTRLAKSTAPSRTLNLASPMYVNYLIYLLLAVVSGLVGLMSGAYSLPAGYAYDQSESAFSRVLNSESTRPIFEYIVAAYYFYYFVILPQYLLRTERGLQYFFRVFKILFVMSFVIGMVDFALTTVGIFLVPRHLADWRMVGVRFHGLAGEPREAFVYLFFGLAVLHLRAYYMGRILGKWWIVAVIVAAGLTQSASGLVGILIFLGLYGLYSLGRRLSMRRAIWSALFAAIIGGMIYATISSSDRIMAYVKAASTLWDTLETRGKVPYVIRVQADSIYPLYDLTVKARELNLLPIAIGSGLGSSSVINDVYDPTVGTINNPSSQIVRTLFESGVLGLFFYVMSFAYPVKVLTRHLPEKKRQAFMLLTLLVLGCSLGNRSSVSFIYLGVMIATFRVLGERVPERTQGKDNSERGFGETRASD